MSASLPRGILTVSIDLELDRAALGLVEQRAVDETTGRLLDLLAKLRIAATWSVSDPANSGAAERVLSRRCGHEIAIAGDSSWVGREAGRGHFGRELSRRTVQGRRAGLAVSTLVVSTADLEEHCDLAAKQGITAVRHVPVSDAERSRRLQPRTLRFGLWSFPVSYSLPCASRWLPGGGGSRAARKTIDRAIAHRGLVQLAIDAHALTVRGPAALRVVERVLQHAQTRRHQATLDVVTLAAAATRLTGQCQSKPSRSILRPAA